MPSAPQTLEHAPPHAHLVQLYETDEQVLGANVSHFLWEGYKRGEGLVIVATEKHCEAFTRQLRVLGADTQAAISSGQLAVLDARETLSKLLVGGEPDWTCFDNVVGHLVRDLQTARGLREVRAYGEMVGLLWQAGQFPAALKLEELWHRLLTMGGLKLFCGYAIDVFSREFQAAAIDQVLSAHTHVLPSGKDGEIESALYRAIDDVLGPQTDRTRFYRNGHARRNGTKIPRAEATILALRDSLPEAADEVLLRARNYYQSERRCRILIENSFDAISLCDVEGNILYASPSTTRVLGYQPHELIGRNCMDLFHPEDAEDASRAHRQVLANPGTPVQLHARMRRADGQWRWFDGTSSNLLDERDVRAIVSNYRDVTERKLAEEMKERQAEDLARSNAELQAFAFAVAHDLKEPLRTVCAFTQLLVQNTDVNDKQKDYSNIIVDSVTRMSALLDDLLSFTRLNFDEAIEQFELRHAVDEAVKNLDRAIAESAANIAIGALPAVCANESHLVEVFQNLIGNAIKYRSQAPLEIEVTSERRGRDWVITIKDNGIGIAPQYQEQIFGLFKRLHGHEIPGTGIGLALCKKIVQGMGGKIWVESELGKGSKFCFTIRIPKK